MRKKAFHAGLLLSLWAVFLFAGCGAPDTPSGMAPGRLVAEKTVSFPAESGENVTYTVQVFQDAENGVLVEAGANTAFFDGLEYEVDGGAPLSERDVDIQWTTLMGDPEPKEDDQLAAAVVTLSRDGEPFSRRKINFVNRAVEIIEEALAQETKQK